MQPKNALSAYRTTKVPYGQSQSDIQKLLTKHEIYDVQFTNIGWETAKRSGLEMDEGTMAVMLLFQKQVQLPDGRGGNIPVRIVIPNVRPDNHSLNQHYRVLYWYLKTKFEAVESGLVEFAEEFMAHLQIQGRGGTMGRLWEMFRKGFYKSIGDGTQGNAGLLPPMGGDDETGPDS